MSFKHLLQANKNKDDNSTSSMPNPSSDSALPIDMVEVVIDHTSSAQLNAGSSDSSPGEEAIFDQNESANSVNSSQNEEERFRREITALRYGLLSLIHCQISDETKSNLKGELEELRQYIAIFLNRFAQGQRPVCCSNGSDLKLVYDDGREELVRSDRSTNAKWTDPPANPQDQVKLDEQRAEKRPIQSTSSQPTKSDKRARLSSDENNNQTSSTGYNSADQVVCNDRKNDHENCNKQVASEDQDPDDQDSIICLFSEEEDEHPPACSNKTTSHVERSSQFESSSDRRPGDTSKKSNQRKLRSNRKLARYQPLASSSSDDDDVLNPANEVFNVIKSPSNERKSSADSSNSTAESSSTELSTSDNFDFNIKPRPRKKVNYKDDDTSSISSGWSTSDSECYQDTRLYAKRKKELKLQKARKLRRLKDSYLKQNHESDDPDYDTQFSDEFIDDTVWRLENRRR